MFFVFLQDICFLHSKKHQHHIFALQFSFHGGEATIDLRSMKMEVEP